MVKSNEEIKEVVNKARDVVKDIYKDDERLKGENLSSDSGMARETDIVFREVLKYLLNN